MQNSAKYLSMCALLSISFFSCGKFEKNEQLNNSDFDTISKSSINTGDRTSVSLFQGFNRMGYSFAQTCLNSSEMSYPKNIEKAVVNLSDNMSENDLRGALNIDFSSSVPAKGFEMSPELKFVRNASLSKLSKSTTLSVYVRMGDSKIANNNNSVTLKPSLNSYFDSVGNLIDPYNFIKKCGNEVVVSQRLSARLLITLKLNFDSQQIMNVVEGKLGAVQNILTSAGKIAVNENLKYLDESIKKGVHLNLYAVQLGGKPSDLTKIVNLKNSCEISKVEDCEHIVNKLNQYIFDDFNKQLDVHHPENWAIESSYSMPYDELNIQNVLGKPLNFSFVKNNEKSVELNKLTTIVNQNISTQVNNYLIASSLLDSGNLIAEEKKNILEIFEKAELNINMLQNFSKECYKDVNDCVSNFETKLHNLILPYDETRLKPNFGTLLARVRSDAFPLQGQKNRSSENFLDLKTILNEGKYSKFYFKLKTIDSRLIEDTNVRFDLMCDKTWYKGYDPVLLSKLYSNYEVLIGGLQKNYNSLCGGNEMVYIAQPKNVPYPEFIVEVWGKE